MQKQLYHDKSIKNLITMNNTGITLVDVRTEAMDAIKKLKEGNMEVKTAQEIRSLLNTVIDTAKVQVEFLKAIPNNIKDQLKDSDIKAIAGTLRDRDAELDATLENIEENRKSYSLKS